MIMEKKTVFATLVNIFHHWLEFASLEVIQFIVAQVCLETGYLESSICRVNNNMFGMKVPKKRVSLALGEQNGHAFYDTMKDSFSDYLLWLQFNGFDQSDLKDFNKFVAKFRNTGFNPSENYADTVIKIVKCYVRDSETKVD